jgi:O-antigen/teichoic acid export membrane protein
MERAKMQKSAVLFKRYFHLKDIHFQDDTPSLRELYQQFISIAWPATVEGALLSVISSADTMMVGTIGPAAIAAVGLTSQPRMILLVLIQSLCVATTALVARRRGEDDQASANAVLKQSMFVVTVLGILMSLAGYFWAEPFMKLAGANEDTIQMSVDYFRIISLGLVLNCWLLCICAAMRAIGKTRVTMVTNITANLVNIVLNYLLIGGNFGFPRLGVKGAAIATVIGTGVACGIAFDSDGWMYVGDRSGTVFRVRDGRATAFATLPPSVAAFHLAMSPEDELFLSAPTLGAYDHVYRISRHGARLLDTSGGSTSTPGLTREHGA